MQMQFRIKEKKLRYLRSESSLSSLTAWLTPSILPTCGPVKCFRAYTRYQMTETEAKPAKTTLA